jgi:hypothetical protein
MITLSVERNLKMSLIQKLALFALAGSALIGCKARKTETAEVKFVAGSCGIWAKRKNPQSPTVEDIRLTRHLFKRAMTNTDPESAPLSRALLRGNLAGDKFVTACACDNGNVVESEIRPLEAAEFKVLTDSLVETIVGDNEAIEVNELAVLLDGGQGKNLLTPKQAKAVSADLITKSSRGSNQPGKAYENYNAAAISVAANLKPEAQAGFINALKAISSPNQTTNLSPLLIRPEALPGVAAELVKQAESAGAKNVVAPEALKAELSRLPRSIKIPAEFPLTVTKLALPRIQPVRLLAP